MQYVLCAYHDHTVNWSVSEVGTKNKFCVLQNWGEESIAVNGVEMESFTRLML